MKKSIIVLLLSMFVSAISFSQEAQQQTGAAVEITQTDSSYSVIQIPRPVTPEQFLGRLDQIVQQLQTPAVEAYGQMVKKTRLEAIISVVSIVLALFASIFVFKRVSIKLREDLDYETRAGYEVLQIVIGAIIVILVILGLVTWMSSVTTIAYPEVTVIENLLGM